ncbi:MAG TPA: hypothetical protein VFV34_29250 [Blastocatellia bacterium]|nr:hypothetical protein [Blastocatellia bacterium]
MMLKSLATIAVVGLALVSATNGFNQRTAKAPTAEVSSRIAKSLYLSQGNVLSSVNVSFDKILRDATGRNRRIQIAKADYLKPFGFRYYATVDGEARRISYLQIEEDKVGIIDVAGSKPQHNLHVAVYSVRNSWTLELWAGSRLLSEIPLLQGKEARFAMIEKYVDAHSFALLAVAPSQIQGLKPDDLFHVEKRSSNSSDSSAVNSHPWELANLGAAAPNQNDAVRVGYSLFLTEQHWASAHSGSLTVPEFSLGNILNGGAVRIDCKIQKQTQTYCSAGCAPANPAEDESWQLFGNKKRAECQAAGCQMCAGICCQPSGCTSREVLVYDCGGSASSN